MGFFDELGKKISDASQDVMQKGKEMADTAKFNSMIHDEEKKITAVYSKIGKKYFEDFKNAPAEGFKEFVDEIHAAQAKIAEIQEKLNALKNEGKAAAEAVATEAKEAVSNAANTAANVAEGAAAQAVNNVQNAAEGAADAAGQAVSKVENAVENAVNENQSTEQ